MSRHQFTITLNFHGDLDFFLRSHRVIQPVVKGLREKTSVKDVIESCGVPHAEVDLIVRNGQPVIFTDAVMEDVTLEVYPVPAPEALFPGQQLQRRNVTRFVADVHLGGLTRNLRLLGFDVAYDRHAADLDLLAIVTNEERALLTRDRRLLMHAVVRDGYYPRSQIAAEQTGEVIRRFDLAKSIAPWTRCLSCNATVVSVPKAVVLPELEPLTRIYYEDFHRCTGCGKVYWAGSHFAKLQKRIEEFLNRG